LDNQKAGIYRYTKEVLDALHRLNSEEFTIYLLRHVKDDKYPNFKHLVIPRYRRFIGWATLMVFFANPWLAIRNKIDIVIEPAHFGPFNLPKRIKRVTIIHDLTPIKFPKYHTLRGSYLQKLFLPGIIKKADRLFTNSDWTKKDLIEVYPAAKGKSETIYLGLSKKFVHAENKKLLRSEHLVYRDYILYVGTIEPRKNLTFLLKSFAEFKTKYKSDLQLVIAGKKGWKSEKFYDLLKTNTVFRDVRMLGFVPNSHLNLLYSGASLFIYPSLYEGFGFPPLEAMVCGTKALVPENSSISEVCKGLAYFYDTNDPKEMADIIHDCLEDSFDPKSNIEKIRAKFNWDNYAVQFLNRLKEL